MSRVSHSEAAQLAKPGLDPIDVERTRATLRNRMFGVATAPTQIDRFIVMAPAGAGAMGRVYVAYDPTLNREVALKLIDPQAPDQHGTQQRQARLVQEAQAMAQLSHPNVIPVYEVGVVDDGVFFAMEYVHGVTLRQWFAHPRSWREVIAVFLQAGRGLAAAHAAGLVHRDFKPDNVLVGVDGRVRVLDFGLADAEIVTVPDTRPSSRTGGDPEVVAGTPAYMAPEQRKGDRADARSDQFSFCVSLWEALHGVRPSGRSSEPPAGRRSAPAIIHQTVARGLELEPTDRYPTMAALLDDLARDPGRRWRHAAMLAGAMTLALGGVVAGSELQVGEQPCGGVRERLSDVWDDSRKSAAEHAIRATEAQFAAAPWGGVGRALGRDADAGVEVQTDACRATHVEGIQSSELLDLRTSCLTARLDELDAFVDVLEDADEQVVSRAVVAAGKLRSLTPCGDAEALLARTRPQLDPAEQQASERVRQMLARARALKHAGRFRAGLELARAAHEAATELPDEGLEAEATNVLGNLQTLVGDYEAAERSLERAYHLAMASRHDEILVNASITLVSTVGVRLSRVDDALAWSKHARSATKRIGLGGLEEARLLEGVALVYERDGQYALALEHHRGALAIREAVLGAGHLHVGFTLGNVAIALYRERELEPAKAMVDRSLSIIETELGSEHPHSATSLNTLASVLQRLGRHEQALEVFERSLTIREQALGPEHPYVAATLTNLAGENTALGRHAVARAQHQRAIVIGERKLGANHPSMGTSYSGLAASIAGLGDYELALVYHRRSVDVWTHALGPRHPHVAVGLNNVCYALLKLGRHAEALAPVETALGIWEQALGPHHPDLVEGLMNLGEALLALEGPGRARVAFERALAISERGGVEPRRLELLHRALAEVQRGGSNG